MVTSSNGLRRWPSRADEPRAASRADATGRRRAGVAALAGACLALVSAAGCEALFPGASGPVNPPSVNTVDHKVRLNSVGFFPDRSKLAVVVAPGGTTFNVVRASDMTVAWSGTLTGPTSDTDSDVSDPLWIADFSAFNEPGDYTIDVPGVGDSPPFTISSNLYGDAVRVAMMGFTGARCGT